jgi:hypothetical protein
VLVADEARLDFAHFAEPVVLRDVRIAGPLTFQGSDLAKGLELTLVAVGGDLDLSVDSVASIAVAGAWVAGDLLLHGVLVDGRLGIERLAAGGKLEALELVTGSGVRVARASLGGGASFTGELQGALFFERLVTDGDLELIDLSTAEAVTLSRSRVGGELFLAAARIGGALSVLDSELVEGADLGDATIDGELALIGSRFGDAVSAGRATLGGAPRIAGCSPADPLQVEPAPANTE